MPLAHLDQPETKWWSAGEETIQFLNEDVLRLTWARRLVLGVQQQAGAAQLRLNVQTAALFPRCQKIQNVRVRTNSLVVPGFLNASLPLAVTPEALGGALHGVQLPVFVVLHLQKYRKCLKEKYYVFSRHVVSFYCPVK